MKRSAGVLLPVSSLPSAHGIGSFGKAAYAFVDFLSRAQQRFWQVLPLGPTSFGDSPYQSFSAFAGNPYFIDLDMLVSDALLSADEIAAYGAVGTDRAVDYGRLYETRFALLQNAFLRAKEREMLMRRVDAFASIQAAWLDDYALFMALKDENGGKPWLAWADELRLRDEQALSLARERLREPIAFHRFLQFLFFEQWGKLHAYANAHGVSIIGDLPIYVPLDAADVWSRPEAFLLDENRRPRCVAGVPPDYFTADGQLWGNPIYDWAQMRETGYAWWLDRLSGASRLYDTIRIDHFRGLASYWRVEPNAITARDGVWEKGPGLDFVRRVQEAFPSLPIIAEDLGFLTDDVRALLAASGFPGMKVLQFAFDTREESDYMPHAYTRDCVCYVGTHDNTTCRGWLNEANPADIDVARRYLGLNEAEGFVYGMLRGGMSSVADLFIAQMQDYLELDAAARMNTPGTLGGQNWRWRMLKDEASNALADRIAAMTRLYGRA